MSWRWMAVALGSNLFASMAVRAQDRPSEDSLFGSSSATPESAGDSHQQADAERAPSAATPDIDRDAALSGADGVGEPSYAIAPADPLQIGGQLYLRSQLSAADRQAPGDWAFSSPALVDLYFDARPNERVRGFVLGRMAFDPSLPQSARPVSAGPGTPAAGGISGSASPSALVQSQSRGPRAVLDQLWIRFDLAHRVFATAGKQHVRWGTGRFWGPTDYLHLRRRNPLDVFDARSGTTMLKLHVPLESQAWNFYGYAVTESVDSTATAASIAAAARAELVFGPSELAAGVYLQRERQPKLAFDASAGLGDFDLYAELAVRDGADVDRVQFAPGATATQEPVTPPPWEAPEETARRELAQVVDALYPVYRSRGVKAQAVAGLTYSRKYNDNDTFTLGVEYFYNGLGHRTSYPYPGLVLPRTTELVDAATFFYLGQQYGAAFLLVPGPYSLDNHSFTLSTLGNFSDRSFVSRFDYSLLMLTHLRFEAFAAVRYGRDSGEFRFGIGRIQLNEFVFSRPPARLDLGLALRIDV
jgi:hypothetical protein